MRERDINRKLFRRGHYEILAKRFREALEPLFTEGPDTDTLKRSEYERLTYAGVVAARGAITNLVMDLALRLQADNSEFKPEIFLDRCSPDPDRYPLFELWLQYREEQDSEQH